MKQHITINQWKELNQEQKIKWLNAIWYTYGLSFEQDVENTKKIISSWTVEMELEDLEGKFGDFTETAIELPNIGQMIEFLDERRLEITGKGVWFRFIKEGNGNIVSWEDNKNLCDYLWEAVKEILEK